MEGVIFVYGRQLARRHCVDLSKKIQADIIFMNLGRRMGKA